MKTKHTKGPWAKCGGFTPKYTAIKDSSNRLIVYEMAGETNTESNETYPPVEEQQANARLIAAAPELLDVVERLEMYLRYDGRPECQFKLEAARAAIAKATGE